MPLKPILLGMLALVCLFSWDKEEYVKEHYPNGTLRSQGWQNTTGKTGYWKYYHPNGEMASQGHYKNDQRDQYWYFYDQNGTLAQEGHFKRGQKVKWWLFYDGHGQLMHKCQLSNGIKNGYCLKYANNKLIAAQKYSKGKKIKEWFSLSAFKKENSITDLR
ncbi:toxin-antitoxin system YwqK family antitoxin [Maribacter sp. 2307ULW6-5]|uniref:toxin-antitoxin system YwqK family antitoxin n=1 Tax=Maribacter sp. 2307ULW6-5 TaxID=3386275 RepID=UPI0039BD4BEE